MQWANLVRTHFKPWKLSNDDEIALRFRHQRNRIKYLKNFGLYLKFVSTFVKNKKLHCHITFLSLKLKLNPMSMFFYTNTQSAVWCEWTEIFPRCAHQWWVICDVLLLLYISCESSLHTGIWAQFIIHNEVIQNLYPWCVTWKIFVVFCCYFLYHW